MPFCPTCNEYISATGNYGEMRHKCPPVWYVHLLDCHELGETTPVHAVSAQRAAEECAESRDAATLEYAIVRSGEATAVVWDERKENPVLVHIEARSEPVYQARTPSNQELPAVVLEAVW